MKILQMSLCLSTLLPFILLGSCSNPTINQAHSSPTKAASSPVESSITTSSDAPALGNKIHALPDSGSGLNAVIKNTQNSYTVEISEQTIALSVQGELKAFQMVELSSETGGELIEILVDTGDTVWAGQTLAIIRNAPLDTGLIQINQQIQQLQDSISHDDPTPGALITQEHQAALQHHYALKLFNRLIGLERKGVSEQTLEDAERQVELSRDQLSLAQAALRNAQLQLNQLLEQKEDLLQKVKRLTIKSPIHGMVSKRMVDKGEYCVPAPMGTLFQILQMDPLRFRFSIPDLYATMLLQNKESIHLYLPSFSETPFRIQRIVPEINETNRRLFIEADLPNPKGIWVPGSYLNGQLSFKLSGMFIPKELVRYRESGEPFVLISVADHEVKESPLTLGIELDAWIQIQSGINEHQTIVANYPTIPSKVTP